MRSEILKDLLCCVLPVFCCVLLCFVVFWLIEMVD